MMTMTDGIIRPARREDLDALYLICLQTANAGADATALYSDPQYPGQLYVAPYAVLAPDFAFVLEKDRRVLGYVVAAPDTRAFEAQLAARWWPPLRQQYAQRSEQAPLDHKVLGQIRDPAVASDELIEQWPAHLHINLLPEAQRGGWGRKLIDTELAALRAAGVSGAHLGVSLQNERVCPFYEKLGFRFIFRRNAIYMGQRLESRG